MSPLENVPSEQQQKAFYNLVRPPELGCYVNTFTREKILATAQPLGFTSILNPYGVTIVSSGFSRFIENGALPANQFGFVLPTDETTRQSLDCAEVHHFDASGRYVGNDIYLYDSYLIEGEGLKKDAQDRKVFRIYSSRFAYGEAELVERRYGVFREGTPIEDFKYEYIESLVPQRDETEEEEQADAEEIAMMVQGEGGMKSFRARLKEMPDSAIGDWLETLTTAVEELDSEVEREPEEIEDIREEIKEGGGKSEDTVVFERRIKATQEDTLTAKQQRDRLKPVLAALKGESKKREKEKQAVKRGNEIHSKAKMVKHVRQEK